MENTTRRTALALLGIAGVTPFAGPLLTAFGGQVSTTSAEAAGTLSPREKIRRRYFPNVSLQTQDGKWVRFYDDLIKDKIVTLNFFYAKCEGICPTVTANLARMQRLLGERVGCDIFMCSISLKPEQDTPASLKEYAEMYQAQRGWTFLTGKHADIELLRRSLGFTNLDPQLDKDKSQHIGNVRYGNEPLMLWAACPGMARPEFIAKSVSWMIRPKGAA
jgi:protein SCO1/2